MNTLLIILLCIPFLYSSSLGEDSSFQLTENLVSYNKTVWCPEDQRDWPLPISLVECCEWKIVEDPYNSTIIWTTGKRDLGVPVESLIRLGNGQLWNQIPSGGMMTDKSRLHQLLVSINCTHFQPETYIFTDPLECLKFFKGPGKEEGTIWVTKDPLSAEGEGIVVNPDIKDLRNLWLENPNGEDEEMRCIIPDTASTLIQRYLMNPLLLEGKKMEIRTYWLVASVEPFIVLYHDGTVRITTRNYELSNWDDPLIHITNTNRQKLADPNYYETESERKWTLQQLANYLEKIGKISSPSEWLDQLRIKLKYIIGKCVKGSYIQLMRLKGNRKWDGRFELFGMDVILDENLRPWLTELQDGPGLSLDPGPKRYLVPKMLKELVDVVLEVDHAHRFNDHNIPYPLKSLGGWEYVETENIPNINLDLVTQEQYCNL